MATINETHNCECGRSIDVEMEVSQGDTLFKCKDCGAHFVGYVGIDSETNENYLTTVQIEPKSVKKLMRDPKIMKAT